ncbi:DUF2271 domain-containing protein [Aquimarina sp. I32.4]|uniref:DUF2271 domain-containing protein n=1 Tax=Aquimarina sp. I32.4 TaxID=2053903 RepID=UPI000CDE9E8E|nr:DUF2271 domain-containing protein [Aquimarina sp. I32.4]
MNRIYKTITTIGFVALMCTTLAFTSSNNTHVTYKCIVQLTNYSGEGAYIAVSLINPDGAYEKTLYMFGDDEEWYPDFKEWWPFFNAKKENIDAITGESIIGGERKIISLKMDSSKIDAGYKLRFETAVEDKEYYSNDAEVVFSSESIKNKVAGNGYIRYIRMIPN